MCLVLLLPSVLVIRTSNVSSHSFDIASYTQHCRVGQIDGTSEIRGHRGRIQRMTERKTLVGGCGGWKRCLLSDLRAPLRLRLKGGTRNSGRRTVMWWCSQINGNPLHPPPPPVVCSTSLLECTR